MNLKRPFDLVRIALLCTSVLFGLAACGDDEPNKFDACAGVECEFGVCDDGDCVNSTRCEGGENLCLQGYSCVDDECEADIACPDGVCARGICRADACVNPPVCQTGQNCLDGFYCVQEEGDEESTCQPDPCADTTCDRGVCELGTGQCVNQDICTVATEEEACLSGFRCLEGSCRSEEDACEELDCQRGVCSFEALECIDAEDCGGSDMNCLSGNYCADDNTCETNQCDANGECARGVCDPSSGECVDAETCTGETDCVDGVVCIGGTCTPDEQACGVDGCPGNQNCAYDDSSLSATCEESGEGCSQALDCLDERICNGGACEEPSACEEDNFEPNDSDGEETDYTDANGGLPVDANICSGDVDRFSFDTTEDPDGTGELIFAVDIADADVGLGTLSLELFDTTDTSVGTAVVTQDAMGNPTGSASVTFTIDELNGGVYTGVISDDGDVSTAGVNYTVRFDVVSADAIAACASPSELTVGTAATGNSANGASSALVTSCGDSDGTVPENVWSFTLAEESLINLVVAPLSSDPDLTVAIRGVCSQEQSEIECSDTRGSGGNEAIETILAAGTYYAVVQGDSDGDGGAYAMTLEATPTVCSEGFGRCLDANDLEFCDATRTGFDTRTCQNGCDEDNDICIPDAGDNCGNAFQVDVNTPFDQVLNRSRYQNNYDPGEGACVPGNTGSEATNGPDIVLEATVPDEHVLVVQVEGVDNDDTSIYVVSDCSDLSNTCLEGANEIGTSSFSDEILSWENDTDQEVTVFAVVDARDQTSVGEPRIEAFVEPWVCEPNSRRCVLDRESQLCNPFGTGYDDTSICEFGCINDSSDPLYGSCNVPTNQTCETAQPLSPGGSVTQDIDPYTDDYDSPQCGVGNSTSGHKDAYYVLENLSTGDIVKVDLTADFDGVLYVVEGCDTGDELGTCVGSDDDGGVGSADETVEFVVSDPGDFVIGVTSYSGSVSSGTFTIEATVTPPDCTPGDAASCNSAGNAIVYCDDLGRELEYTCGLNGCDSSTDLCVDEAGDSCFDALSLDPTGGTISEQDFDNSSNQIEVDGVRGSCSFGSSSTDQNEFVYSISLSQGDLLTAEFEEDSTSFFGVGKFFLLRDCQDLDTCEGYQDTGDSTIEYFADVDQTIYLIVDSSSSTTTFEFDLTWTVEQPGWICEPMSRTCLGTNQVEVCSDDGTQLTIENCSNCNEGICQPDPATADECSVSAPNAGSGITVLVDPDDFTDQINSSSPACFSASFGTSGADAFYQVDLGPYESVVVNGESNSTSAWPVVYIMSDCTDPLGASCIDGDASAANVETRYTAGSQSETVVVGLDNDGFGSSTQPYVYRIEVVVPDCLPTDAITCNSDNDGLIFCSDGIEEDYDCGGSCTNNMCDTPRGDACFDTIALGTGSSGNESGDWIGDANTVNPGTQGGLCEFDDSPDGSDDIYEISLNQDDLLKVSVTSSIDTAQVYILENCEDTESCLAGGSADDEGNPAEAAYWSDADRTVFVVVDRSSDGTGGTYDLSWDITPGAICTPDQWTCSDPTTAAQCNPNGDGYVNQLSCPAACDLGACAANPPDGDTCNSAVAITGDVRIVGSRSGFTNADEIGSCGASSPTWPSLAEEVFYAIDLPANSTLEASLGGDGWPILHLVSDCNDTEASCILGDNSSTVASISYFTAVQETVYLVADNENTGGDFFLDIEINSPNCDPDTFVQSCNADDDGFEYCDANGFTQSYTCGDSCDPSTGRCVTPDGDTCIDPLDGNPSGTPETFVGTLADFTDVNDLGTGNSCTGSRTIGPDAVYAVDLAAGEKLTATAVSTDGPEDIAIYAATGPCGAPVRDVCVAGSDTVGADSMNESFEYTAVADETIYVYVDSFYAGAEGDYSLTIDVQ